MRIVAIVLLGLALLAGGARAQEAGAGWLGVHLKDLTKEEADALGWEAPRGAKLVKTVPGGPAEAQGLTPDDILVSLDGVEIANVKAFIDTVRQKAPGTEVTLAILRAGREMRHAVKLGARPPWDAQAQSKFVDDAAQAFSASVTQAAEKSEARRKEQEALTQKAAGFRGAVMRAVGAIKVQCGAKRSEWMFISFAVFGTGQFQELKLDGSSGDPVCNNMLLSAVRRVHLPSPPPDLPLGQRTFKIEYKSQ